MNQMQNMLIERLENGLELLTLSDANIKQYLIDNAVPEMKPEQLEYLRSAKVEDVRGGILQSAFDDLDFAMSN